MPPLWMPRDCHPSVLITTPDGIIPEPHSMQLFSQSPLSPTSSHSATRERKTSRFWSSNQQTSQRVMSPANGGYSANRSTASLVPMKNPLRDDDLPARRRSKSFSSQNAPVNNRPNMSWPQTSTDQNYEQQRPRQPVRRRILFYHRHKPHYGFTNFSPHPVTYKGKTYPTSEHLFQSFKVRVLHRVQSLSAFIC